MTCSVMAFLISVWSVCIDEVIDFKAIQSQGDYQPCLRAHWRAQVEPASGKSPTSTNRKHSAPVEIQRLLSANDRLDTLEAEDACRLFRPHECIVGIRAPIAPGELLEDSSHGMTACGFALLILRSSYFASLFPGTW